MSSNRTYNIWRATDTMYAAIHNDMLATQKERLIEKAELRPWVKSCLVFQENFSKNISNNKHIQNVMCCIQVMIAILAAISITWSASVDLALFGLVGLMHKCAVAGVMCMSMYSCLLTSLQNITFGIQGAGWIRTQKLRLVEIKLFRSPFMPDPTLGKTQAVKEYLNYYALEKIALKKIYNATAYGQNIDEQWFNKNAMPIELRARMALTMHARISANSHENQRRVSRLLTAEYDHLLSLVDPGNCFDKVSDSGLTSFINQVYVISKNKEISEEQIKQLFTEEQLSGEKHFVKMIALQSMLRVAYFAQAHANQIDVQLISDGNHEWHQLTYSQREEKKKLAFRWALVRHLHRQKRKVTNAIIGHYVFMKLVVPAFCFFTALMPGGFSILSLSPVTKIVSMIGKGWESILCVCFWFTGVVNYLASTRKDVEKICAKLCAFVSQYIIHLTNRSSVSILPVKRSFISSNLMLRFIIAISMAAASCAFTIMNIQKLLHNPAIVGAETILGFLFRDVSPWLQPLFMPLSIVLSVISAVLSYIYVAKYYSLDRIPTPKHKSGYETFHLRVAYIIKHNFNFKKYPMSKIAKLFGSVIAIFQSIVFLVSALDVMSFTVASLLMPSVFLICSARNRKDIEAGFDLYNQWYHKLDINFFARFYTWFDEKLKAKKDLKVHVEPASTQTSSREKVDKMFTNGANESDCQAESAKIPQTNNDPIRTPPRAQDDATGSTSSPVSVAAKAVETDQTVGSNFQTQEDKSQSPGRASCTGTPSSISSGVTDGSQSPRSNSSDDECGNQRLKDSIEGREVVSMCNSSKNRRKSDSAASPQSAIRAADIRPKSCSPSLFPFIPGEVREIEESLEGKDPKSLNVFRQNGYVGVTAIFSEEGRSRSVLGLQATPKGRHYKGWPAE